MTKLTKRMVDQLAADGRDRIVFDDELSGFGVRLKPSGAKSYVLRYRAGGAQRSYTLGSCAVLTPSEARRKARALLGEVAEGDDPSSRRQEDRRAPTMAELCADYMDRHARPNKRAASIRDDQSMIDQVILPALRRRKVRDVCRREIETLHHSLKAKPYRANRVLSLVAKMFSLAVAWGWRADNPARGIPKYQEDRRDRWLSEAELGRLLATLDDWPDQDIADAVRLLIFSGARRSEVLHATWEMFDLARGVWIKPSHHTKQKRTEHVPLSQPALAILHRRAGARGNSPFLFPGRSPDKPLTEIKKSWARITEAAALDGLRLHDLRHTYASHLVSSGVSLPIVGRLLGHTQAQTTHRYAHLADGALRDATEAFGRQHGGGG